MIRGCCLLLLLLQAHLLLAQQPCLAGSWVYLASASDSPDNILQKIRRQQKQQQRLALPRPQTAAESDSLPTLPQGLPAFVFSTADLSINQSGEQLLLQQGDSLRQLRAGYSQPVSLAGAGLQQPQSLFYQQSGSVVIETVLFDHRRIEENWTIDARGLLQQRLLLPGDLLYHKRYQRGLRRDCQ